MGVSTDGIICYGIAFDEDFEFPWSGDDYEGDIEEWWLKEVQGYKPPFELYDEHGEYINGVEPSAEQRRAYFAHKREFKEAHPLPAEDINYCSNDCSMYILAVPGKTLRANRGYPEAFTPENLAVTEQEATALVIFCQTHEIDFGEQHPRWYLCSYWG